MQFHRQILNLKHHFFNLLLFLFVNILLHLQQIHSNNQLLQNIVITVMLVSIFLPLLELFLQLEEHPECLSLNLFKIR